MKVSDLQMQASIRSLENIKPGQNGKSSNQEGIAGAQGAYFADILGQAVDKANQVQFSAHAVKRLEQRSLMFSTHELERLNIGVQQLDAKGSKNSLVLVDDTAFVVSVSNKTVITAIDKNNAAENVYTNIDSVAIV